MITVAATSIKPQWCIRLSVAGAGLLGVWLIAAALSNNAIAQQAEPSRAPAVAIDTPKLQQAVPAPACENGRGVPHALMRITDTASAFLDDGREVRVAGVIFPPPPVAVSIAPSIWPPQRAARDALMRLASQGTVEIDINGRTADRYGRPEAQIYMNHAGAPLGRVWLQHELVDQGHAIVSSRSGGLACLEGLLRAEAGARTSKRGLWANAAYRIHNAANYRALLLMRSNFTLVEGKVVSVTARSGRLYLNFGDDWRQDFTVSVARDLLKAAPGSSEKLSALAGHKVRVRGWIERRYGPAIEIFNLQDIEDLSAGDTAKN